MDLAIAAPVGTDALAHRSDVSARQGIPLEYMDQILGRLRDAGLIASTRGRGGGYRLAKEAAEISMHDIFTSVEDAYQPVQCLDGHKEGVAPCGASPICVSKDVWSDISLAISRSLSGIILADVVARHNPMRPGGAEALPDGLMGLQECRPPRKSASKAADGALSS
jgi:Rrf2 family iron-sulfur cluster assembly transcriptional regulator